MNMAAWPADCTTGWGWAVAWHWAGARDGAVPPLAGQRGREASLMEFRYLDESEEGGTCGTVKGPVSDPRPVVALPRYRMVGSYCLAMQPGWC